MRRFTTGGSNESMPAWSPDGREIAFVSDRENRGIYARHVDTSVERQLAAAEFFSQQEIVERALVAWLRENGCLNS